MVEEEGQELGVEPLLGAAADDGGLGQGDDAERRMDREDESGAER